MLVQLGDQHEFLDEVGRDRAALVGNRCRIGRLYRRQPLGGASVLVVATAKVLSTAAASHGDDYDVFRYEAHAGDLTGIPAVDEQTNRRADELVEQLQTAATEAGFNVAAGAYVGPHR